MGSLTLDTGTLSIILSKTEKSKVETTKII